MAVPSYSALFEGVGAISDTSGIVCLHPCSMCVTPTRNVDYSPRLVTNTMYAFIKNVNSILF